MKLIIIHGSGLVAILNKVASYKKTFDLLETLTMSSKTHSFSEVLLNLATPDLFCEKKLVVLEDFDENLPIDKFSTFLDLTVIIKFSKSLPANSKIMSAARLLKAIVINLEEDKETTIFPFLDAVSEKNHKALRLLDNLINEYGCLYVMTMLGFMLRRLILPPKNTAPFFMKKLEIWKRNFPVKELKSSYWDLIQSEFKVKQGLQEDKVELFNLTVKLLN